MKPTPLIISLISPADDLVFEHILRLQRMLEQDEQLQARVFIYTPDVITPVAPQTMAKALEKIVNTDDWLLPDKAILLAHFRALADMSVLVTEPKKTPMRFFPIPKAPSLKTVAAPTAKMGAGRKNDPRLTPGFRR